VTGPKAKAIKFDLEASRSTSLPTSVDFSTGMALPFGRCGARSVSALTGLATMTVDSFSTGHLL